MKAKTVRQTEFSAKKLIMFVLATVALGSGGSVFTAPAINGWYASLVKPAFSPPNWLFGPVWTILFALMGIASYLVYRKGLLNADVQRALAMYLVQFGLNILWSFLFFGLRSPWYGFIDIILLWIAIIGTIILFYRVDRMAAYLLLPYFSWVSFAAILNWLVYRLN